MLMLAKTGHMLLVILHSSIPKINNSLCVEIGLTKHIRLHRHIRFQPFFHINVFQLKFLRKVNMYNSHLGGQCTRHMYVVHPEKPLLGRQQVQLKHNIRTHENSPPSTISRILATWVFFKTHSPLTTLATFDVRWANEIAHQEVCNAVRLAKGFFQEWRQLKDVNEDVVIRLEHKSGLAAEVSHPFKAHDMFVSEISVTVKEVSLDDVVVKIVLFLDSLLHSGFVHSANEKNNSHGVLREVVLVTPSVPKEKLISK